MYLSMYLLMKKWWSYSLPCSFLGGSYQISKLISRNIKQIKGSFQSIVLVWAPFAFTLSHCFFGTYCSLVVHRFIQENCLVQNNWTKNTKRHEISPRFHLGQNIMNYHSGGATLNIFCQMAGAMGIYVSIAPNATLPKKQPALLLKWY